jgi:hypothetical protein
MENLVTEEELDKKLHDLARKCCDKNDRTVSNQIGMVMLISCGVGIGLLILAGLASL